MFIALNKLIYIAKNFVIAIAKLPLTNKCIFVRLANRYSYLNNFFYKKFCALNFYKYLNTSQFNKSCDKAQILIDINQSAILLKIANYKHLIGKYNIINVDVSIKKSNKAKTQSWNKSKVKKKSDRKKRN